MMLRLLMLALLVTACGGVRVRRPPAPPAPEAVPMRAAMALEVETVPDSVTVHAMDNVGRWWEHGLVLQAGDTLRLCAVRWVGRTPAPPTMFDTAHLWETPHVTVLDYAEFNGGTCARLVVSAPAEDIEIDARPFGTYPLGR